MKAITFSGTGGPDVIQYGDREVPTPQQDEVLIKVKAAGVNRPDVMQRKGMYNPPPGVTDIPGLEVAGRVVQLGDENLPIANDARVCAIIPGGGYAEYVTAKVNNVALLPAELTFAEGGAIMETFMTVWSHLFKFAGFQPGSSILIHGGASGIGTTATMLSREFGASKIFTTVSNPKDQKASEKLGADRAINYKTHDFVEEIKSHTQDKGVDFILDIIAGDYVQRNYEAAAMYGTILQVGIMHGNIKNLNLFPMLAKRLTHQGITLRSQTPAQKAQVISDLQEKVWPLLREGKVKPQLYKIFKLSEAKKAHQFLDQSKHFGKLVLMPE